MTFNMNLLVLDLDGTLTKSDNIVRFSVFMLKTQKQLKFLLFFPLVFLLKFRIIGNRKFKILYAKWILKNLNIQLLNQCVSEFINTKSFSNGINSEVFDFIGNYGESEKVILSANYSFLVEPISKFLKIRNYISINLEIKNNKFTGRVKGQIPYGPEKINSIREFLKNKKYYKVVGLADSKSDIPLLKFLDEGYLLIFNKKIQKTAFKQV